MPPRENALLALNHQVPERIVYLIGDTNMLGVYTIFECVADHKIELIDRLAEVYPIDLIDLHDDWGTQKSTFMSVDTWKELLSGPMSRIVKHTREKGIHLQIHSCGKVEPIVPEMLEAGIEHWSSCQSMNDI